METIELVGHVSKLGMNQDYVFVTSAYDAPYWEANRQMVNPANVKYTFDKETGDCIAVELIK